MLWIKKLASGSFLVLSTHILHFHKKTLHVLDISRFTTGEIGPQSRLYMGLSKLDSKGFHSTANGLSPNETISILEQHHRTTLSSRYQGPRGANLTRNETFDRGPEHFLLKSLLAALLLEFVVLAHYFSKHPE